MYAEGLEHLGDEGIDYVEFECPLCGEYHKLDIIKFPENSIKVICDNYDEFFFINVY